MRRQASRNSKSENPVKVLHLIDSGGLYGAERMLLDLVQEQLQNGMEPLILSASEHRVRKKPIEAEAERRDLPIKRWEMKPGLNLKEAYKIMCWARAEGYEVFHSHGFKFNILLALIPRFIRKTPVVATLHGYVNSKRWRKIWVYESLDQYLLRLFDKVCLVTEKMNRYPRVSQLDSQKKMVIPNGIRFKQDIAVCDEFRRKYSKELSKGFNLLFVGRLSQEKNLEGLLFALSKIARRKFTLWVFGEGPLEHELKELAESLGLGKVVFFLGYVDDAGSLMPNFDLLVMPSLTEGLPITLLEALYTGLPVFASKVGEVPVVLGDGEYGLLIECLSPDKLAIQIEKIICDSSELEKFKAKGRELVVKKYSSERMFENYLDAYTSAIKYLNEPS